MSAPAEKIASGLRNTVLVVDNDVLVRMPICDYLRDCGYRVLEAATAEEAMVILQKQDIHVDVVLTDIEMPAGQPNGFAFATWARSIRPGLDVVLASTPERAARAAGELCEQGPLLARPYESQLVLQRIKRLLATRARQTQT
jgi:CheY-like chemotaxis protein